MLQHSLILVSQSYPQPSAQGSHGGPCIICSNHFLQITCLNLRQAQWPEPLIALWTTMAWYWMQEDRVFGALQQSTQVLVTLKLRQLLGVPNWCRWDNNLLHDLSLESSLRAKMRYQNHLKSSLYTIKQNPEITLRGPNTDSQKYLKHCHNYSIKYC